ncbi:hypothetical protein AA313_de0204977 [Arthrobotrys entomopaga]|nr:hypothetical protein AA313_de0204977 [Arthrobotrys entomopaga]
MTDDKESTPSKGKLNKHASIKPLRQLALEEPPAPVRQARKFHKSLARTTRDIKQQTAKSGTVELEDSRSYDISIEPLNNEPPINPVHTERDISLEDDDEIKLVPKIADDNSPEDLSSILSRNETPLSANPAIQRMNLRNWEKAIRKLAKLDTDSAGSLEEFETRYDKFYEDWTKQGGVKCGSFYDRNRTIRRQVSCHIQAVEHVYSASQQYTGDKKPTYSEFVMQMRVLLGHKHIKPKHYITLLDRAVDIYMGFSKFKLLQEQMEDTTEPATTTVPLAMTESITKPRRYPQPIPAYCNPINTPNAPRDGRPEIAPPSETRGFRTTLQVDLTKNDGESPQISSSFTYTSQDTGAKSSGLSRKADVERAEELSTGGEACGSTNGRLSSRICDERRSWGIKRKISLPNLFLEYLIES